MANVERIDPQQAWDHVQAGQARLICAYDDDAKFAKYQLTDAMALSQFRSQADSISKDQELIFYCA